MPRIERTRDVVWEGNVARGDGHDQRAQRARSRDLPFSLPTRIGAGGGQDEPRGAARRGARRAA